MPTEFAGSSGLGKLTLDDPKVNSPVTPPGVGMRRALLFLA
jgi:hypothetical protein